MIFLSRKKIRENMQAGHAKALTLKIGDVMNTLGFISRKADSVKIEFPIKERAQ
jgi:hypothetical protein